GDLARTGRLDFGCSPCTPKGAWSTEGSRSTGTGYGIGYGVRDSFDFASPFASSMGERSSKQIASVLLAARRRSPDLNPPMRPASARISRWLNTVSRVG